MDVQKLLDVAIDSAKKSGKLLKDEYSKKREINIKIDKSIVTDLDNKSNDLIINTILKSFPSHAILSEESGENKQKSDYLWVIDPIDGTSNYVLQIPFFCISISLLHNQVPLVAVVYDPIKDELFTAVKNRGAKLNGKTLDLTSIIDVRTQYVSLIFSRALDLKRRADCVFSSLNPPEFRIRNLGASALELAYVACNRLSGLIIMGNNPWDIYAGILLIQEAGGIVTDSKNIDWDPNSKDVVAGHKIVHKSIIKCITNC